MIKRIFLDIDGVLNKLPWHLFDNLGIPWTDPYPSQFGFDIVSVANHYEGYAKWTSASFWQSVTRVMWATVPLSDEAGMLIGHAEHMVGKDNVFLLTTPTLSGDSLAGKLDWICAYMPHHYRRQYVMTPHKRLCADPESLLIDDYDRNVDEFRAAGGQAVLLPRPWNTDCNGDVTAVLSQTFFQQ